MILWHVLCMDTLIFYISLPILYILHDLEELLMRKSWEKKHYDEMLGRCPLFTSLVTTIKNLSQIKYTIVILEQFLFLVIVVVMAVYSDPMPMYALIWGFGIHSVLQHILAGLVFRIYFPGLVTSILLLPYFAYVYSELLNRYSVFENFVMAVCGLSVIILNLFLMYWLMKKFNDL